MVDVEDEFMEAVEAVDVAEAVAVEVMKILVHTFLIKENVIIKLTMGLNNNGVEDEQDGRYTMIYITTGLHALNSRQILLGSGRGQLL